MTKDQLEYIIGRYDHFYDSVNNKGQFYLGLNTLILGGLGASFTMLNSSHTCTACIYVLLLLLFTAGFASSFYTLKATLPYLTGGAKPSSLIFFGSVSSLSQQEFVSRAAAVSEDEMKNDLTAQVYHLAHGLTLKFNRLKIAGYLIACEFILLIPFLFLFFINVK
jgi:hypothetical protein